MKNIIIKLRQKQIKNIKSLLINEIAVLSNGRSKYENSADISLINSLLYNFSFLFNCFIFLSSRLNPNF